MSQWVWVRGTFILKSDFSFLRPDSSAVAVGWYPGTNELVKDIWDGECGSGSQEEHFFHTNNLNWPMKD